jgi:hypothetical protein
MYSHTKNTNLGIFWRALEWTMLIYTHTYFMVIWNTYIPIWYFLWPISNFVVISYFFPSSGILCQKKSGNPAEYLPMSSVRWKSQVCKFQRPLPEYKRGRLFSWSFSVTNPDFKLNEKFLLIQRLQGLTLRFYHFSEFLLQKWKFRLHITFLHSCPKWNNTTRYPKNSRKFRPRRFCKIHFCSQSCDHELQRQRCKNLQHYE